MGNIPISLRMMNNPNNLGKSKPRANINTVLPAELLEMVLRYLPPRDLRNATLVCQLWREVGEAPGLWRQIFSRATFWWLARENTAPAVAVPACRRGREVREMTVDGGERDPQNPFLVKQKVKARASINKFV